MWEMRCGKISKKAAKINQFNLPFYFASWSKALRGHFFIRLAQFFFVLSHFCALDEANIFLSSHFFIPSISSFWHIYERSRQNSRIIAYLDKYNQFFHIIIFQLERIASRTCYSYILFERFKYILFVRFSTEVLTTKMFYDSMMVRLWQFVRCVINDQPRFVTSIVIHQSRENVPF